jgi:hypothetical protein
MWWIRADINFILAREFYWGRGHHPSHAPGLAATESQDRPTRHATHGSKTKYSQLYSKGHSALPEIFLRTHHIKLDTNSMRVALFAYGEYKLV